MRATVAILLSVVVAFLMFTALGTAAQETNDAAIDNGTDNSKSAYNMTSDLYNGVGQAFGPGLVWMGVAAIVVIALGFLVKSGGAGR